jgi:hypothetical protein
MSHPSEQLERKLNSFNAAQRQEALRRAVGVAKASKIKLAGPGTEVNLHAHSLFSYNAYDYSPSNYAQLARKRGHRGF